MSIEIKGGKSGRPADVTERNMLRTFSINAPVPWHVVVFDQRSWTYRSIVTPAAATDVFFYFQNTDASDLIVTAIKAAGATLENIDVERVTGTPVGGTALIPSNRYVGSTRIPNAIGQTGASITALTTASSYERLVMAPNVNNELSFQNDPLVVPSGEAIALRAVVGGIAISFGFNIIPQLIDPSTVR